MSEPITAQMVNSLRGQTGAGLLDCKKALTEANGNVDRFQWRRGPEELKGVCGGTHHEARMEGLDHCVAGTRGKFAGVFE